MGMRSNVYRPRPERSRKALLSGALSGHRHVQVRRMRVRQTARSPWCVVIALAGLIAMCSCDSAATSPASTSSSAAGSPLPAPTFAAADLLAIMPTAAQIAGWQTATRTDLSGPYTPTNHTNPGEKPPIATSGFVAGQRETIGAPGVPGLNVLRVAAEAFTSARTASAAMQYYVGAFASLGYSTPASTGNLPSPSSAVFAANGFIAPEFAMGTATKVYAFAWRLDNLIIVVRAGGDTSTTNEQAIRWASIVNMNVPKRSGS